ncbi:MAG: hypothetical protein LBB29_00015 [Holosporaceae bacterium]|jgi:hypothetical protein|nr:hypothetical protein [Holosporaceae bacterium]
MINSGVKAVITTDAELEKKLTAPNIHIVLGMEKTGELELLLFDIKNPLLNPMANFYHIIGNFDS